MTWIESRVMDGAGRTVAIVKADETKKLLVVERVDADWTVAAGGAVHRGGDPELRRMPLSALRRRIRRHGV